MTRRVFVLGAGASAAPELGIANATVPMMQNFFTYASTLQLRHDYSSLWRIAERLGIDESARVSGTVTLEQLFVILDILSDRLWDPLPSDGELAATSSAELETLGAFDFWGVLPRELMVSFITDVLTQATAPLKDGSCQLHDRFVRALSKGDAVISLNYDLLIDQSLWKSGFWCPFDGYGTGEFRTGGYLSKDVDPFGGHRDVQVLVPSPADRSSDVLLLKPHGSLNWWWWTVQHESDMRAEYPRRGGNLDACGLLSVHDAIAASIDPVPGDRYVRDVWSQADVQERKSWLQLRRAYKGRSGGRFIIPPIGDKATPGRAPSWISEVWTAAFRVLAQADEIVLIGYSVPETDRAIRLLLSDARSRSPKRSKMTIVNPGDPSSIRQNLRRGGTPHIVDDELVTEMQCTFAEYVDDRLSR